MLCDDLEGWDWLGGREVREGRDICIPVADSLHCTAGTNTIFLCSMFLKCLKKIPSTEGYCEISKMISIQLLAEGLAPNVNVANHTLDVSVLPE